MRPSCIGLGHKSTCYKERRAEGTTEESPCEDSQIWEGRSQKLRCLKPLGSWRGRRDLLLEHPEGAWSCHILILDSGLQICECITGVVFL